MQISDTVIEDTYAEAFSMKYARIIVTAHDDHWLEAATNSFCGYGTSVIGCDAEVGFESSISESETPDGRVGISLLAFGFSNEALAKAILNRVGQCLMTCPTTAVYNGLPDSEVQLPLGSSLRYFGDGFQKSKLLNDRRFWRIPVMDGEFIVSEQFGIASGVAGGNLIIQATDLDSALSASISAVNALKSINGVITPFPGGVVRSGSKVGSKYEALRASTNDSFCPTIRSRVESQLNDRANAALEIVIDGVDERTVGQAMITAIQSACVQDVVAISAGNYGGKLGKYHFHLHELLAE